MTTTVNAEKKWDFKNHNNNKRHLNYLAKTLLDIQGSHSFTDKKSRTFPGLSRIPMKNFPGPFQSPRMFKFKEKTAFTYNIQSVVHCRKFSMKQNVYVSCSEFRWKKKQMQTSQHPKISHRVAAINASGRTMYKNRLKIANKTRHGRARTVTIENNVNNRWTADLETIFYKMYRTFD